MDKSLPIIAPALPTEATDSDESQPCGYPFIPVKEDRVLEKSSTSNHTTKQLRPGVPSWILGSTSKRSSTLSRDFPSKIGKGDEATQRLPGDVLICPLAYEGASAHRWPHGRGHATILSNRLGSLDDPAASTCVLSRKVDVLRQLLHYSRFLPKRTGLGHLISASPWMPDAGGLTWGLDTILLRFNARAPLAEKRGRAIVPITFLS
jgi:hypothetical protein